MTEGSYFELPAGTPTEAGSFFRVDELPALEILAGLTLRPLEGANMMLNFARYEPFAEAPLHAHAEEQFFLVLEGEYEVEVGGETRTLGPGEGARIPSWVPHRARAGASPASQLDVFSPPRRALLDQFEA
jgi:quercetin dioxygenase-like cupin family protein